MMPGRHRTGLLSIAALLTVILSLPILASAQGAPPAASAVNPPAAESAPAPAAQAPGGAPAGGTAPAPSAGSMLGSLPDDLSPRGMFLHADIVVRTVIVGLLLAALATWTIWLAKTLELMVGKRRLRHAYRALRDARSLGVAMERLPGRSGVAQALVREAADEWQRSAGALDDRDGLKERIALHLERVEAVAGRRMMAGTGILATVGSTAPFVGLFGTVWGIMNSFIGISKLHTTNLAVVAPGIAEALLATACGLVAAIPAVVIYNHFVRQIGAYKALAANAASAVMALVSRDLSHGDHPIPDVPRSDAPKGPPERPAGAKLLRMVRE